MYIDQKYKDATYSPPSHDIPVDKKNEKWHRQFCEYIYSSDLHGISASFCDRRDDFTELRLYAIGRQDEEQYKNILLGKKKRGEDKRKAYFNIDWEILPIIPKFRSVVTGIYDDVNFLPTLNAVDENSGDEKEMMKWRLWVEKEYGQGLDSLSKAIGVKRDKPDFVPENKYELQVFDEMGGIKLNTEIGMEEALTHTNNVSDHKEVWTRVVEDFFDLGIAADRDWVEPGIYEERFKYIDPEKLIVIGGGGRKDRQFKDATCFGYITNYTIVQLRKEFPKLSEHDIRTLAQNYQDKYGNRGWLDSYNDDDYYNNNSCYGYDDFNIPVLDCEFVTVDTHTKERNERFAINGSIVKQSEIDKGKIVVEGDNYYKTKKKTVQTGIKVWRKAKWIIGTEHIFEWGLLDNIKRPSKRDALSSFNVYEVDSRSKVEMMKPLANSIQLTWLKYQDMKARARNAGIAIEFSALQNITLGGDKMKELEVLKMFDQTGRLIYKATTHRGTFNNPNQGKPIQEIKGNFGAEEINTVMASIKSDLDLMREITGITDVIAATDPNPEVGLGQSKMAAIASNNALKPIFMGYRTLYQNTMKGCMLRIQVLAKGTASDDLYSRIIGADSWAAIKQGSRRPMAEYGIRIDILPTQEDRQSIEIQLNKAAQVGKDGKASITTSDYFAIRRMLSTGASLKAIQVFLSNRELKKGEEDSRLQKENMELNTKNAIAIEDKKTKNEKDMLKFKADQDIRVKHAELLFKSILEGTPERELKMQQALLQVGVQINQQEQQAQQQAPPQQGSPANV